jgi:predicted nucleotidyltransferase
MRLTSPQTQAIISTFLEVFGKGEIRLFGSRVDDSRRGGDIDLYITPDSQDKLAEARIHFLARLKRRIGEQKIDLVIAATPPRAIDNIAQKNGVVLCQRH